MKYVFFLHLWAAICLSSCETELKVIELDSEPRYVINSLITPDSLFSCYVHQSTEPYALEYPFVSDASVNIYETQTGNWVTELLHQDSGFYKATVALPIEGKQYSLLVKPADGEIISATTEIPIAASIDSTWFVASYGGEASDRYVFVDILNNSTHGFLCINTYTKWYNGEDEPATFIPNNAISTADTSILRHNTIDDDPISIYMPIIKQGETNVSFVAHGGFHPRFGNLLIIQLKTVSPEYYHYVKSWPAHLEEQSVKEPNLLEPQGGILGFMNTPVPMFSNIEGGVGIFAAYTSTYQTAYAINLNPDEEN